MPSVLVIGEALIDVVYSQGESVKNIPGGSPANTAVALSRLNTKTFMKSRTSSDEFGVLIREYLIKQNVDLKYSLTVDEPSSVIDARILPDGSAKYSANLKGAVDFGWSSDELNQVLDSDIRIIQLGSLTSYIEPGGTNIEIWIQNLKNSNNFLLVFDPNIRHPLDGQEESLVRKRAKKLASIAHLVKASDEDLKWINPDKTIYETAAELINNGTKVVVMTLGSAGAVAVTENYQTKQISAQKIKVVDTIGAGDTFSAALITQLLEREIQHPDKIGQLSKTELEDILTNCAEAAAITCSREGANPPLRHEVSW